MDVINMSSHGCEQAVDMWQFWIAELSWDVNSHSDFFLAHHLFHHLLHAGWKWLGKGTGKKDEEWQGPSRTQEPQRKMQVAWKLQATFIAGGMKQGGPSQRGHLIDSTRLSFFEHLPSEIVYHHYIYSTSNNLYTICNAIKKMFPTFS